VKLIDIQLMLMEVAAETRSLHTELNAISHMLEAPTSTRRPRPKGRHYRCPNR
jgi:hypothetical protein